MVVRASWRVVVLALFVAGAALWGRAEEKPAEEIIVDSQMTMAEAMDGLDPQCPASLRERQALVAVKYWGFDGKLHSGQIVVDRDLAKDVAEIFEVAREAKFPMQSVIPCSHPRLRKDGAWSDDVSMAANNTSGFAYRRIEGTTRLSNHALGLAVDVNPLLNPYIKGETTLPPNATYDVRKPGTLTADHPVTRAFLDRGWEWGGDWKSLKDYQHFEKPPKAGQ